VALVDEQPAAWADVLEQAGLRATTTTAPEASELLERVKVDVVLVVVGSSPSEALSLISQIAARHAGLPVLALSRLGETDEASLTDAGAANVLALPVDPQNLSKAARGAVTFAERAPLAEHDAGVTDELIGRSKVMDSVRDMIGRVAPGTTTVLVRGESGTGKELVARAIHRGSDRRDGPFVKIHCAALPDTLLESELFGYEKGAFTGAAARKLGRVEVAQGGTLFLDEIGDISPATQVKLLRLLQDRELERLGGTEAIGVDVRFVAATHRDLEAMVKKGELREDLFFRLNVVPLWVPPLRARRGDIDRLAAHFCTQVGRANHKPEAAFDADALEALASYRWPGNVRELQNVVERLVVLSRTPVISADAVRPELGTTKPFATAIATAVQTSASLASEIIPLEAEVRKAERRALVRALAHADDNRSLAARLLGIHRGTLYKKLREHGLE
jgi:two-component system response regulator AtoC